MLFWTYLCVYSLGRFVIEFYRQDTPFALGLAQAQLLSILTAMFAVWMLVYQWTRANKYGRSEAWASRPTATPSPAPVEADAELPEHAPLST
jgi:prolipoprotein diacylglyceryltransferase